MPRIALFILLLAAVATADIVYLSNGREIEGKARKAGQNVVITLRDGSKITVPAEDVLYIAVGPLRNAPPAPDTEPARPATAPPNPEPLPAPAVPTSQPIAPTAQTFDIPLGPPPAKPLTSFNAVNPEPIVYLILRNRLADPAASARNDEQLRTYRAYAHDRRRQLRGQWVKPEEFIRRRQAFDDLLDRARDKLRNARVSDSATDAEKQLASRHRAAAWAQLRRAADVWPDPDLRTFLLAVAALQSGDSPRALNLFRQLSASQPTLSVYQQGLAHSLLAREHDTPAIEAYTALLRLLPDNRDARAMLQFALQQAPGALRNTPAFQEATALLNRTANRRSSRRPHRLSETWLFPDESVRCRDGTLPKPPVDRYSFRQALAVPVAPHALLVDRTALAGARAVYVRTGVQALQPAGFRLRRRDDAPLAVLHVPTATFTPALPDADADTLPPVPAGEQAVALAVDFYAAMGNDLRRRSFLLPPPDQPPAVAMSPGEPAGPVFARGLLVGFLPGWLDVWQDQPEKSFLDLADLDRTLRRARRRGRADKDTLSPDAKPLPHQAFLVHIIAADRFEGE